MAVMPANRGERTPLYTLAVAWWCLSLESDSTGRLRPMQRRRIIHSHPVAYERILLQYQPVLDGITRFIARRHRLTPEQAGDLASGSRLKVLENDFAVLRSFEGAMQRANIPFVGRAGLLPGPAKHTAGQVAAVRTC